MTAPARHAGARDPPYSACDAEDEYAHRELFAGERVGPPLHGSRRKTILRGVILLIALGMGWALVSNAAILPEWLPAAVLRAIEAGTSRPAAPAAQVTPVAPVAPVAPAASTASADAAPTTAARDAPPSSPQRLVATKVGEPPAMVASSAPLPETAAPPPAATAPEASPLPPPTVDAADPYQVRAAAVGLHTGLSRVLLARLSPTDYRNAGIAIQTAVAKTPDDGVFVWPRQRKPELALFKVHFVPGAAPGCRRYVVTVAKDGWLTTALPMEKCRSEPGPQRR
jgi:hypothetical protein